MGVSPPGLHQQVGGEGFGQVHLVHPLPSNQAAVGVAKRKVLFPCSFGGREGVERTQSLGGRDRKGLCLQGQEGRLRTHSPAAWLGSSQPHTLQPPQPPSAVRGPQPCQGPRGPLVLIYF